MLIAIQFPLADARSFLDTSSRISKPLWHMPEPDSEFVRFFGIIRERPAGGIIGWGSENENFVCEANRALTFQRSLSFVDRPAAYKLILRRAFERFFFDGTAVGKFEVGIATKTRTTVALPADHVKNVLQHFVKLPITIRNPLDKPITRELADAGDSLAKLYLIASSPYQSKANVIDWHVQAGRPLLFMEYHDGENVALPNGARAVALPEAYGLRLHQYAMPYKNRKLHMWLLGLSAQCDPEKARALRLYLLRLHSEHECLRLMLRNVMTNNVAPVRDSSASNQLQQYFADATTRIKKWEAKSGEQFSGDIPALARETADALNPGEVEALIASVEKLDPRRNVKRTLKEYIEAVGSTPVINITEVQGDYISAGNIGAGASVAMGRDAKATANAPNTPAPTQDVAKP